MKTETKFLLTFGFVTIALIIAGVFFFSKNDSSQSKAQKFDQNLLTVNAKHTKGEATASAQIIEFGDFQCPACAAAAPIMKSVTENNKDKAYFVFRHYPLAVHKNAKLASQAAEAASRQGKFWEFHDILYLKQNSWSNSSNAQAMFEDYAKELKLDVEKFKQDTKNTNDQVMEDYTLGNKFEVESTPTFFINGQKYSGVIQEGQLLEIINNHQ